MLHAEKFYMRPMDRKETDPWMDLRVSAIVIADKLSLV